MVSRQFASRTRTRRRRDTKVVEADLFADLSSTEAFRVTYWTLGHLRRAHMDRRPTISEDGRNRRTGWTANPFAKAAYAEASISSTRFDWPGRVSRIIRNQVFDGVFDASLSETSESLSLLVSRFSDFSFVDVSESHAICPTREPKAFWLRVLVEGDLYYSVVAVIRFFEGRWLSGSIMNCWRRRGLLDAIKTYFFKEPYAIDSAAKGIRLMWRPNLVNTNRSTDTAVIDQQTEISSARVSDGAGKRVGSPDLPRGASDISSYRSRRNRERLFTGLGRAA